MRLFVAIPMPPIAQALARGIADRNGERFPGYRWIRPDLLHIPIKFIGDVDDVTTTAARTAIGSISPGEPISLKYGQPFLLGPADDKRVLVMKLTGEVDRLEEIHSKLEESFARLGFARETRPFLPHVTVAHLDHEARPLKNAPKIDLPKPWFFTTGIHLMKSTLGRPEPAYETLLRIPMLDSTTL